MVPRRCPVKDFMGERIMVVPGARIPSFGIWIRRLAIPMAPVDGESGLIGISGSPQPRWRYLRFFRPRPRRRPRSAVSNTPIMGAILSPTTRKRLAIGTWHSLERNYRVEAGTQKKRPEAETPALRFRPPLVT